MTFKMLLTTSDNDFAINITRVLIWRLMPSIGGFYGRGVIVGGCALFDGSC